MSSEVAKIENDENGLISSIQEFMLDIVIPACKFSSFDRIKKINSRKLKQVEPYLCQMRELSSNLKDTLNYRSMASLLH